MSKFSIGILTPSVHVGLSHTLKETSPRDLVDKAIDMRCLEDPLGLAFPVAGLFVIQGVVETFLRNS